MSPDENIKVIDELVFMRECATRINLFVNSCPNEALHIFKAFIPYKHELREVHARMQSPTGAGTPNARGPGITFVALMAAVLQTHHGTGYYLAPVIENDRFVCVRVARQDEEESGAKD